MSEFPSRKSERLKRRVAGGILGILAIAGVASCSDEETCPPFKVYAQNRFPAKNGLYGAAGRFAPDIDSEQVASFGPNQELTALGWVARDEAAYPHNPDDIKGEHWFLIETDEGTVYVNDAAVRAAETDQYKPGDDPEDLGPIVERDPACEIK